MILKSRISYFVSRLGFKIKLQTKPVILSTCFFCQSSHAPCLKTMKIETPLFRKLFTPELEKLIDIFQRHKYELRIAGGAVRDLLMEKLPSDVDFATTATPQQMQSMFEAEHIRMFNTRGEKHGTVTCRINDKENFEVTTLRIDVVTDGRHAEVQFTKDWQMDAERRDLTINSLFLGFDGTIYDYFNGQEDLANRKIRFVGNASSRIQEDYLRILRYFRFYGRISPDPNAHDESTLKAIRENAQGLAGISGERIWVEVKKIFMGQHVDSIVRMMHELQVTKYLGFGNDLALNVLEDVWRRSIDLKPLPMTLIPALFTNETQLLHLQGRVKMSKDEFQLGMFVLEHRDDDFGENQFAYCEDLICDMQGTKEKTKERLQELLKYLDHRDTLVKIEQWTPPRFPVSGHRLMERGNLRGPKVAKVLTYLRNKWKESRYTMNEDELLQYLDEAIKNVS